MLVVMTRMSSSSSSSSSSNPSTAFFSSSSVHSDYSGQFIGFPNSPSPFSCATSSTSSGKCAFSEIKGDRCVDKQGLRGRDGQEYEEKKKLILLLLNRVNEIELEEVGYY